MPGEAAILGPVDEGRRVLDAGPHGEGFGLHGQSQTVQLLKGVPGTVAYGQDHLGALQDFLPLGRAQPQPGEPAILQGKPRRLGGEPHLAPQGDDLLPNGPHHPRQLVRADVGLGLIEDFLRGAGPYQLLQHFADAAVPGAGGQLAIGEGARPTLAELDVGLGVKHPFLPKPLNGPLPLLHRLAPLQHDGGLAALG